MSSDYWKTVGKKLFSLGKTVFETSAPVVIDYAVVTAVNKACEKIDEKLKEMYKNTAVNSCINLFLNIAGILIAVFLPFGNVVSRFLSAFFFIGAFAFWVVRTVLYIKNYGKQTIDIGKNIYSSRSISKGINNYVFNAFPLIALAYGGIEIASNYLECLNRIPKIDELVKVFIKLFWQKLALFGGIVASYSILVFWILKPIILRSFTGLTWYELYFFPITYTFGLF